MLETNIEIINKLGLHARAAAKLVNVASQYDAQIELVHEHRRINAKSIMGVMMLAASQGTHITLIVNGTDEQEATQAIIDLVNDKFGETK